MHTVTLAEAQARLPELIAETRRGEEIVVTEAGQPVLKLSAPEPASHTPSHGDLLGCWVGKARLAADWDEPLKDMAPYME